MSAEDEKKSSASQAEGETTKLVAGPQKLNFSFDTPLHFD